MKRTIHHFIFLISITALLFSIPSCRQFADESALSSPELEKNLTAALADNSPENTVRKRMLDLEDLRGNVYHSLKVDSIVTADGVKYFTALVEFDNPVFDRFAVYDSTGRLRLLDKSLNGYLALTSISSGKTTMLSVVEKFISRDSIKIERLNLYLMRKDTVTKALHVFTLFDDRKVVLRQNINGFQNNALSASFFANKANMFAFPSVEYSLDTKLGVFTPRETQFDILVRDAIEKGGRTDSSNLIYNKISSELSIGKVAAVQSETPAPAPSGKVPVSFTFPAGWSQKQNIYLSTNLKKPLKGNLFYNDAMGAKLWLAEIPAESRAEDYVPGYLELIHPTFQNVRASEKILLNRTYYRFFEISCPSQKYIAIFHAAMNLYQRYESDFEKILGSIKVNCQ